AEAELAEATGNESPAEELIPDDTKETVEDAPGADPEPAVLDTSSPDDTGEQAETTKPEEQPYPQDVEASEGEPSETGERPAPEESPASFEEEETVKQDDPMLTVFQETPEEYSEGEWDNIIGDPAGDRSEKDNLLDQLVHSDTDSVMRDEALQDLMEMAQTGELRGKSSAVPETAGQPVLSKSDGISETSVDDFLSIIHQRVQERQLNVPQEKSRLEVKPDAVQKMDSLLDSMSEDDIEAIFDKMRKGDIKKDEAPAELMDLIAAMDSEDLLQDDPDFRKTLVTEDSQIAAGDSLEDWDRQMAEAGISSDQGLSDDPDIRGTILTEDSIIAHGDSVEDWDQQMAEAGISTDPGKGSSGPAPEDDTVDRMFKAARSEKQPSPAGAVVESADVHLRDSDPLRKFAKDTTTGDSEGEPQQDLENLIAIDDEPEEEEHLREELAREMDSETSGGAGEVPGDPGDQVEDVDDLEDDLEDDDLSQFIGARAINEREFEDESELIGTVEHEEGPGDFSVIGRILGQSELTTSSDEERTAIPAVMSAKKSEKKLDDTLDFNFEGVEFIEDVEITAERESLLDLESLQAILGSDLEDGDDQAEQLMDQETLRRLEIEREDGEEDTVLIKGPVVWYQWPWHILLFIAQRIGAKLFQGYRTVDKYSEGFFPKTEGLLYWPKYKLMQVKDIFGALGITLFIVGLFSLVKWALML
ncbi:hypothetical protein ACFL54_09980, partial [Planctomycetota bacterium]